MRTFAQMIERIRKSDEELMAALVEASGYVLFQYHANNRKVDGAGANLAATLLAAVPVWLQRPMQGWLQQGKRDATRDMDYWQDVAAAKITGFFREQEQKRQQARAKRAEKAAQKPAQAEEPVPSVPAPIAAALEARTAFLCDDAGTVAELTADELAAAWGAITALRTGALKLAA